MASIQDFRNNFIKSSVQKASRYKVMLNGPGGKMLTVEPKQVTIPGREMQIYRDELWGPERPIPVKRTFTSQIITVFQLDINHTARKFIEDWMNELITPGADGNIRQDYIRTIRGCSMVINCLSSAGDMPAASYKVIEPWPSTIMPSDMGWDMVNQISELTVSWAYREYTMNIFPNSGAMNAAANAVGDLFS